MWQTSSSEEEGLPTFRVFPANLAARRAVPEVLVELNLTQQRQRPNVLLRAKVDTGAAATLMSEFTFSQLPIPDGQRKALLEAVPRNFVFEMANATRNSPLACLSLYMSFKEMSDKPIDIGPPIDVWVIPGTQPLFLIGTDYLNRVTPRFNMTTRLQLRPEGDPAGPQLHESGVTVKPPKYPNGMSLLIQPLLKGLAGQLGVCLWMCVTTYGGGVSVGLQNSTDKEVSLPMRTPVGISEPYEEVLGEYLQHKVNTRRKGASKAPWERCH
jgi:hypothetical protein